MGDGGWGWGWGGGGDGDGDGDGGEVGDGGWGKRNTLRAASESFFSVSHRMRFVISCGDGEYRAHIQSKTSIKSCLSQLSSSHT